MTRRQPARRACLAFAVAALVLSHISCSAPPVAQTRPDPMAKTVISTPDAPKAIGPYSQAIEMDGWVFCSGQIALDPATGELLAGDVRVQTRRVLENLKGVLAAAGCSFQDVVKTTVFLANLDDFSAMNEVYGGYFTAQPPARATVQAARLPRNAQVEIEVIARKPR